MPVRIQAQDFDAGAEIAALRRGDPKIGAVASFIGVCRDANDEKAIEKIISEARRRWDVMDALVIHRIGELKPTDQIVLVVVTGAHRGEAFAACEFIMDYLKTRAPFWKKEETPQGARWVEARASDDEAAERWEPPKSSAA